MVKILGIFVMNGPKYVLCLYTIKGKHMKMCIDIYLYGSFVEKWLCDFTQIFHDLIISVKTF